MYLDEIRQILEMMRDHELAEFELEREQVKLRLKKHTGPQWAAAMPSMPQMTYAPQMPAAGPASPGAIDASAAAGPVLVGASEDVDLAIVKSPIVGTYYGAPEPGAKPFIEVGQTVKKGQALCIIEAMKLMNEIDAELDGEIVKIYVENGQAVQYGERLFAIKPA